MNSTPRFTIRRLPNITTPNGTWSFWPWIVRDHQRPWAVSRYATHAEAIAATDQIAGEL